MADLITNMSIITLSAGALSINQQTGRVDFYNHPVTNYMFLTRNYNIRWKELNGKAVTIFKTKQSGLTNNTINQQSSWHIQNTPPNNSRKHVLLNGIFSTIDHILSHKTNLNKVLKIETIKSIFSNHNEMKLETNGRRKTEKAYKMWKLKNSFLNNQ